MEVIEKDLLGICIPTYNRSGYLRECLRSVIDEFSPYGFPIYISDNCSTDNTTTVVSSFENDYDNIKYVRNNSNLGLYRNILNVMQMAETRYIWLMGDDDAIRKGSVEKLLNLLNKNPDFVVLNSSAYDKELILERVHKVFYCQADRKYDNGSTKNILNDLKKSPYYGFMSSMVLRRNLLVPLIPKYYDPNFPLFGTAWLPFAIFYEAIFKGTGYFICDPVVLSRINPRPLENNDWTYFYLDRFMALAYLKEVGYSKETLKPLVKAGIIGSISAGLIAKADKEDLSLINDYVKYSKLLPIPIQLTIQMIDLIPNFLVKKMKQVILVLRESRAHSLP